MLERNKSLDFLQYYLDIIKIHHPHNLLYSSVTKYYLSNMIRTCIYERNPNSKIVLQNNMKYISRDFLVITLFLVYHF